MAKLLKQAASMMRLIGTGQAQAERTHATLGEVGTRAFEGLDTTGDTPEALRAELEALRALLNEMRSGRSATISARN
jgi:hypothetical protein